jgi:hypothetical protein
MYEIEDVIFHDLYGRGEIDGFNNKDRNMVNRQSIHHCQISEIGKEATSCC